MNENNIEYDIEMAGVFQKAMEKKNRKNNAPGNVEKPWRGFDCREILMRMYSGWLPKMVYSPGSDEELQKLLNIINGATFRYLQILHDRSQHKILNTHISLDEKDSP